MTPRVRIAIIGMGAWGTKIAHTLKGISECEVTHAITREYHSLLSRDDIDAVVIATPGSTHADVALPFIQKGLPVFIEKPMTTSEKDAKRILTASREAKVSVFVGHLHLYNPAFIALKAQLKKIGTIRHMDGEGASFGPFREDMSVLWDWAPHDVSMMLDIMGSTPDSVQAWADTIVRTADKPFDSASVRLTFKNGVIGEIHSSLVSQKKRRNFRVVGTNGMVTLNDVDKKLTLLLTDGEPVEIPFATTSPLEAELRAFIASCRGRYSDAGARQGYAVVSVLDAAEESARNNSAPVRVSTTA